MTWIIKSIVRGVGIQITTKRYVRRHVDAQKLFEGHEIGRQRFHNFICDLFNFHHPLLCTGFGTGSRTIQNELGVLFNIVNYFTVDLVILFIHANLYHLNLTRVLKTFKNRFFVIIFATNTLIKILYFDIRRACAYASYLKIYLYLQSNLLE